MILPCVTCGGSGRIMKSKYGGNDPDVWDAGPCEACDGSGNHICDKRGCGEVAIGFNDDGEALCEDCSLAWIMEQNET